MSNKYMIRQEKYQIKELGELIVPDLVDNSYFLCRQPRQGDIDIIDSFFLLRPISATVDQNIADSGLTQGNFVMPDAPVAATVDQNIADSGLTQGNFVIDSAPVASTVDQNIADSGITQGAFVMNSAPVASTVNQNIADSGITQGNFVMDSASNTAAVLAAQASINSGFETIDLSSGTRKVVNNNNIQQNVQETMVVQTNVQETMVVQTNVQETAVVQTAQPSTNYTRRY